MKTGRKDHLKKVKIVYGNYLIGKEYKENMVQTEEEKLHSSIFMEHLSLNSENINNLLKPEPVKEPPQHQKDHNLFVIPEVVSHRTSHNPSHNTGNSLPSKRLSTTLKRDSSIRVTSEIDSKGGTTDPESSSDDDTTHTDDDHKVRRLRRASSIPCGARRKASSDFEPKQV